MAVSPVRVRRQGPVAGLGENPRVGMRAVVHDGDPARFRRRIRNVHRHFAFCGAGLARRASGITGGMISGFSRRRGFGAAASTAVGSCRRLPSRFPADGLPRSAAGSIRKSRCEHASGCRNGDSHVIGLDVDVRTSQRPSMPANRYRRPPGEVCDAVLTTLQAHPSRGDTPRPRGTMPLRCSRTPDPSRHRGQGLPCPPARRPEARRRGAGRVLHRCQRGAAPRGGGGRGQAGVMFFPFAIGAGAEEGERLSLREGA